MHWAAEESGLLNLYAKSARGDRHKSPLLSALTTDTYLLDRNCLSKVGVDLLAVC